MNAIRIDSCRKCGQELQVTKLCIDCNQPLHFDCSNCNLYVDDPIHQHEVQPRPFSKLFGAHAN
ncbi:MAG: hypothetical protein ISR79_06035 [Nitrosopumilus sp.]|nr:hypothetical protein [Nitrosopumilus sp.]